MVDLPAPVAQQEPETPQERIGRLERRLEREKTARKEAETLLEEKSRSLYQAKTALERVASMHEEQTAYLRSLFDQMPSGVAITIADGSMEFVNLAGARLVGLLGPEERIGDYIDDFETVFGDVMTSRETGPADEGNARQCVLNSAMGEKIHIEVNVGRVEVEGRIKLIWIFRDIESRLQAERDRLKLEDELRQAQRLESLGTLAGGIAHELNTPIQFVTDNMNFLGDTIRDLQEAVASCKEMVGPEKSQEIDDQFDLEFIAEEAPEAVKQSLDGLKRIAEIVLAVKRFSHPTSSGKEEADINEIIRTTATVSKNQWKYIAELDLDLDETAPRIACNAGELNQVFLNLVVNAAHAIEDAAGADGGGRITISTRASGDWLECRISDNGCGMSADVAEHIFDPFFTTKEPGRGTGQGLSIVHSIITQSHAGTIKVKSRPGEGTSFIVRLPVEAPLEEAIAVEDPF